MKNGRSSIAEEYFKAAGEQNREDFLNYACERMLSSYLAKTMYETRKAYAMSRSREEAFCVATENIRAELGAIHDTYDYFFYELIEPLTIKQRELIILCYKHGYSDSHAAKRLGISKQAVGSMRKRALTILKNNNRADTT